MKQETKEKQRVKTSDIYQAAYLLASGSTIEELEVIRELDKDVCILTLEGRLIREKLHSYLNKKARIDPVLYQKAVNRIREIIFKTITKAKAAADLNCKGGVQ